MECVLLYSSGNKITTNTGLQNYMLYPSTDVALMCQKIQPKFEQAIAACCSVRILPYPKANIGITTVMYQSNRSLFTYH